MLFRLDNQRLIINAQEFPSHVVLMTVGFQAASGQVFLHSYREETAIPPTRTLDIFPGFRVFETVLPFWDLVHQVSGTSGITFSGSSAFRMVGATYAMREFRFTMLFPANGGGIIRHSVGGQEWDLSNPTFNPRAPLPEIDPSYNSDAEGEGDQLPPGISGLRVPGSVLIQAYRRVHQGVTNDKRAEEIEKRRQARLASFDLKEVPASDETDATKVAAPSRIILTGTTSEEPAPSRTERIVLTGEKD